MQRRIKRLGNAERKHESDLAAENERWEKEIDPFRPDGFPAEDAVQAHFSTVRRIEAKLEAVKKRISAGLPPWTVWHLTNLNLLSMRDLAAAEIIGFRRQGSLALVGIVISTVASVWSVYL